MNAATIAPIDPTRTALLVMDYQPAIVARVEDPTGLLGRAAAAIATARAAGATVGYVRVALTDEDRAAVPVTNKSFSAIAGTDAMADGDPDNDVHPDVAPEAGDIRVRKSRVGPFSTTDLTEQLAAGRIDTLVLAGISTSGVVLSTVRQAADNDYRLVVLADCCADFDPEVHRVLIEKVFPRQADVIDSTELAALLGSPDHD
jgi:nicotinamidase-related amidase